MPVQDRHHVNDLTVRVKSEQATDEEVSQHHDNSGQCVRDEAANAVRSRKRDVLGLNVTLNGLDVYEGGLHGKPPYDYVISPGV